MRLYRKRIGIISCIALLLFASIIPKQAHANPVAIAAGGVEAGVLALWGGAALVAGAGTTIGLDPALMNKIEKWGKDTFDGANSLIKAGITSATQAFADGWNTTAKYAVSFSSDVTAYLKDAWNKAFGSKVAVDSSGMIIMVPTMGGIILPSQLNATGLFTGSAHDLGMVTLYSLRYGNLAERVVCDMYGKCFLYINTGSSSVYTPIGTTPVGTPDYGPPVCSISDNCTRYANAMQAYAAAVISFGLVYTPQTDGGEFVDESGVGRTYKPVGFPIEFNYPVTIPAIGGVLNPDGTVGWYKTPTIGRVGAKEDGDVAIGFPLSVGNVGALSDADAITANPANTGGGEVDTPAGDLDFSKFILAAGLFTKKFPFSIPWDVKAQLDTFDVVPKSPVLHVNKNIPLFFGTTMQLKFDIDFSMFDTLAVITRWFLIIAFDFGMILSIRKLMPE